MDAELKKFKTELNAAIKQCLEEVTPQLKEIEKIKQQLSLKNQQSISK